MRVLLLGIVLSIIVSWASSVVTQNHGMKKIAITLFHRYRKASAERLQLSRRFELHFECELLAMSKQLLGNLRRTV